MARTLLTKNPQEIFVCREWFSDEVRVFFSAGALANGLIKTVNVGRQDIPEWFFPNKSIKETLPEEEKVNTVLVFNKNGILDITVQLEDFIRDLRFQDQSSGKTRPLDNKNHGKKIKEYIEELISN